MLSKAEWVKKYVYKWQGIKNCDTRTVEGGYLFLWNDDRTSATGHSERNIKGRSQAIAYHYDLYVREQSNNASTRTAGMHRLENRFSSPGRFSAQEGDR